MSQRTLETDTTVPVRTDPIRVLLVDDHALFRRGVSMVLGSEDDIEIVGEAADGAEAIVLAEQTIPDIVLMDVRMPGRSGLDACAEIKSVAPNARIVMLTISDEEADLYDALKLGAQGYLLKSISIDEIADAVRSVQNGQSLVSPSMAAKLITEFSALKTRESAPASTTPKLTERELEVLRLIATGLSNRQIGRSLFISENTVKNHVRNILDKLQLHSRMQAVLYAAKENLVKLD